MPAMHCTATAPLLAKLQQLRDAQQQTQEAMQRLSQEHERLLQLFLRQQGAIQVLEELERTVQDVPLEDAEISTDGIPSD